jgi:uncharacterized protein (DUF2141 family)
MSSLLLLTVIAAQASLPSAPDLGKAAGRCRAHEDGPAFLVSVEGLKDTRGLLKLEVYPDNDSDFLADDNKLIAAGKVFRRVEMPVPATGPVQLCIRVPHAGRYAVSLLHDRDSNHKFGLSSDGIGFAGNPKLGWSKPPADAASANAGSGLTPITIVMNYRHGLLSFGPIRKAR